MLKGPTAYTLISCEILQVASPLNTEIYREHLGVYSDGRKSPGRCNSLERRTQLIIS